MSPDEQTAVAVSERAAAWSAAMKQAGEEELARVGRRATYLSEFKEAWNRWHTVGHDHFPLPPDWRRGVSRMYAAGIPFAVLDECITIAMTKRQVRWEDRFSYFMGVAHQKLRELQNRAMDLVENAREEPSRR